MAGANIRAKDVIIGRAFRDQLTDIGELTAENGLVTIQGMVESIETKVLRNGEVLLCTFKITDKTGSVLCRCFLNCHRYGHKEDEADSIIVDNRSAVVRKVNRITVGMAVTVRGEYTYDTETGGLYILVRDLVLKKTDVQAPT